MTYRPKNDRTPARAEDLRHTLPARPGELRRTLLRWYDRHARDLPWRVRPNHDSTDMAVRTADPYHVWLSEVMLQQTTVAAVGTYYAAFLDRWPTVTALAAASLDDVLVRWQGLGYYARARNLHACARVVAEDHQGRFPDTEAALRSLPGVGAYTAAAIAAIAFDRPTVPVDGNVVRVLTRLCGIETPLPGARDDVAKIAPALADADRPGDFAQALMDLGATVCTPRRPQCLTCPWQEPCLARRSGDVDRLPVKAAKAPRPTRYGVAFWLIRPDGQVLLRRRPARGLLGGMMEVPSTDWRAEPWTAAEATRHAPMRTRWRSVAGVVSHTFTHFELTLTVLTGTAVDAVRSDIAGADALWWSVDRLGEQALPTVMKKIARLALTDDLPTQSPPIRR